MRAESTGLGEDSAGPARRTRAESAGLGEDKNDYCPFTGCCIYTGHGTVRPWRYVSRRQPWRYVSRRHKCAVYSRGALVPVRGSARCTCKVLHVGAAMRESARLCSCRRNGYGTMQWHLGAHASHYNYIHKPQVQP